MHKRIALLRQVTADWCPEGGAESQRLYETFKDYRVLPYAGGMLDQPEWFRRDLNGFALLDELARLVGKLPKAKPGMQTFEAIGNNGNA